MHRNLLALIFVTLPVGCASASELDDVEEDSSELTSCALGTTCGNTVTFFPQIDDASKLRSRSRPDITSDVTGWTPRVFKQVTTRVMTRGANLSLSLRGAAPGDPFRIDDLILFEILRPTGERIDAVVVGDSAEIKLAGAPVRRLGGMQYEFAAGTIDLAPVLPDGPFRIRASAIDGVGLSYVSKLVADVRLAPAAPTFTLAKDPGGTTPFYVDDIIQVSVNGEARPVTSGPVHFTANVGDKLRLDLVDLYGGCLQSDDIWLSGPGITPVKVIAAIPQTCGTSPSNAPFRTVEVTIGSSPPSDPFDPAYCDEPALTTAQAAARFAPGATTAHLTDYDFAVRKRTCNAVTGCTPWTAYRFPWSPGRGFNEVPYTGRAELVVDGREIELRLHTGSCTPTGYSGATYGATCSAVTGAVSCGEYSYHFDTSPNPYGGHLCWGGTVDLGRNEMKPAGVVGNSCMALRARGTNGSEEYEGVVYARY